MKILFIVLSFVLSCVIHLHAQDEQKISLSSYVAENCGVPTTSQSNLDAVLKHVITGSGFAEEYNQRFILTAKVDVINEEILSATTPPMYSYTLSYNLYIGDGIQGTLFASTQVESKGTGKSKDKAYSQALKGFKNNNPQMRAFVEEGKRKIIDYYNLNGASIIKNAQTLAQNQQFDEALWQLSTIPSACTALYNQANDLMMQIYDQQITQEGASMLAEARAIWNAGQNRDAADRAGALLAQINPQSPAFKEAQQLHNQIAAKVKAIDSREWAFRLQKQKDATSIAKAQISAAKEVAVAWAKNQPRTIYKIYWW